MIFRLLVLLLLLLFIANNSNAQLNYVPGTILTRDGQSYSGFIELTTDLQLTISCNFNLEGNSEIITLYPSDLLSFSFTNGRNFLSRKAPIGYDTLNLFVEQIVGGKASLLVALNHYFLEKDSVLYELISERVDGVEKGTYGKILKQVLSDCPKISRLSLPPSSIKNNPKDIYSNVINLYNSCLGVNSKSIKAIFYPYLGASISNYNFSTTSNGSLEGFSSKKLVDESPFLGGIDIEWRKQAGIKKVSLLTGLLFSQTIFNYSSLTKDRSTFSEIKYNKSTLSFLMGPRVQLYKGKKTEIASTLQFGLSRILFQNSSMVIEKNTGGTIYSNEFLLSEKRVNTPWVIGLIGCFKVKNSAVYSAVSFLKESSSLTIPQPINDKLKTKTNSLQFSLGIKI
jgi:hypothetical protein